MHATIYNSTPRRDFLLNGISYLNIPFGDIPNDKNCTLKLSEGFAEITSMKREPVPFNTKHISGGKYLNTSTGEVRYYNRNADRKLSVESVKDTYKRLQDVIKANFHGGKSEIFMTLGYEQIMSDVTQLNKDFHNFWKSLKRRFPECEYIAVLEFKENKSLHLHIFIKGTDGNKLYFDRELIKKLWGHKDVYLQRIHTIFDVDRLIKYLNPFQNEKKYERIGFYQKNIKIYRKSKGIINYEIHKKVPFDQAMDFMKEKNYKIYDKTAFAILKNLANGKSVSFNEIKKIKLRSFIMKYEETDIIQLTKVVTNDVILKYAHLFEAWSSNNNTYKRFSVMTLIPKEDTETLNKIYNAIEIAKTYAKEKYGNKISDMSLIQLPLHDGDNADKTELVYRNNYYMTASSDYKPGVINEQKLPLSRDEQIPENSYGRVSMYFEPYIYNGRVGIKCCLINVKVLKKQFSASKWLSTPDEDFE